MTFDEILARLKEAHADLRASEDTRVSTLRAHGIATVAMNNAADNHKKARNRVEELERELLRACASQT